MSGFKITSIYVFVATDDTDTEGIPAIQHDGVWMPLIAADAARLEALIPMAVELAHITGSRFELRRYNSYEVVEGIGVETLICEDVQNLDG